MGRPESERVRLDTNRLLTRREVEAMTGLSRSTLYALMSRGTFPRPLRVGGRAVRWSLAEIERWIANLPRAGVDSGHGSTS